MPIWALLNETYAISSPLGDQLGFRLLNSSLVLCLGSPAVACLTQMLLFPPLVEVKATHLPSGEKAPIPPPSPSALCQVTTSVVFNDAGVGASTWLLRPASHHQSTLSNNTRTGNPQSAR